MIINIIDRQLNFLGQMDEFESFMPAKKYYGIGGFELHTYENARYALDLQKENIIFTSADKAYIILYRHISSITGKLVIKGMELKGYFKRWLVFPPPGEAYYRVNDRTETIIKTYVQSTLNRKGIANIEVALDRKRGIKTVYQSRYKNLASEIEKIGKVSGLG
ncbi:MAG TPA: hypothetical protein VFD33_02850, partial [Bacillota bacterium]|nr:hypothetical protein [Bacillota bacterium]